MRRTEKRDADAFPRITEGIRLGIQPAGHESHCIGEIGLQLRTCVEQVLNLLEERRVRLRDEKHHDTLKRRDCW
jgi:hypothetical protein